MDYQCTTSVEALHAYLDGAAIVAFDFETSPTEPWRDHDRAALDAHKSHIVGVSVSVREGSALYVPLRHRLGYNACPLEAMEYLRDAVFENIAIIKVAHNLAFESMFLYAQGIIIQPPCYDTIAAAQLTLKSSTRFRALSDSGLKKLAKELFDEELPTFEAVTAGGHFDELHAQDAETVRYACADSDFALRLYHRCNAWFDKYLPKHRRIVEQVESPTAVFCGLMKYNGLLMDTEAMHEKAAEAERRLDALRADIAAIIGDVPIGANASTSAFKQHLYHDLGLPVLKTTAKHQEAADDQSMILLAEWCAAHRPELVPLFEKVQAYRKWGKLSSTYITGYLKHINPATGRLHPDLMPLATETGRFAARNPNLQNCFDSETEILTLRGFVPFAHLTPDDAVAQWEHGEISFVAPDAVIAQDYDGEMIHVKNQHIDLCMTPDHRCLLQDRKTRQLRVVPASEYPTDCKQLHAAQYAFGHKTLTAAEITLLAATQADGNYHDGGISFVFSKARKYRRLLFALQETNVHFTDNVRGNGHVRLHICKSETSAWIMDTLGAEKAWSASLLAYDRRTVKGILAEIVHWDGCFTRSNHYSSSVKQNADWMQILYALTGSRAHLREYHNGNPNAAVNYQLDVVHRDYSLTTNAKIQHVPYSGKVYCVTVPSGFIMVRRKGEICISGNCPRKDNDPIGVRRFIVAPEGHVLLSLDFSQIELRVGAFFCRDPKMLEVYRTGGDIHAETTAVVYHIPFEQAVDKNAPHYKERRTIAKNCNFGVFFGLFAKGLQRTLKFKAGLTTSLDECEQIIANLKAGYPRLAKWQAQTAERAARCRYTETWLGRRRYLPGIVSEDWGKRSYAERCSLNTPIQGSAADILKLALCRIVQGLPARPWLRPLLQVHDELVFEVSIRHVTEAVAFIKGCMEAQPFPDFDVPIVAETAIGPTFGDMVEMED